MYLLKNHFLVAHRMLSDKDRKGLVDKYGGGGGG